MSEWPPQDRAGWHRQPLPPQPVHHEPRYSGPPRPAESPWRRGQRLARPQAGVPVPPLPGPETGVPVPPLSRPETGVRAELPFRPDAGVAAQPLTARHEGEPPGGGQFYQPDPGEFLPPDQDDDAEPGRFVPGFGDDRDPEEQVGRPDRKSRARARPPKRPRRRRFRWLAPLAAILVILVPLAVGGGYAYRLYTNKYHPSDYAGAGTGYIVVQVPSGATATGFGPELQQLGVVASARAFVIAAEQSQNPNGLLPGFYGMHRHMKASLAYALLLNPKNLVQITVTVPEGLRLTQLADLLGARSGIPATAYRNVLKNPARLGLPASANGNPEGYLFPATYVVVPHETALRVLTGMVKRFEQEAAEVNLPVAARGVHLTAGQVITMASLVQAEGGKVSDYPKIARVIDNRLARGMPLQLDSTVLYGLHSYGILASDKELASPSPYNTYKHKGLTPGPIDSPGNAAIQAALHPAPGNWLYFVTVNPKTHETLFTSSEAQFEQYRAELEHNLGKG